MTVECRPVLRSSSTISRMKSDIKRWQSTIFDDDLFAAGRCTQQQSRRSDCPRDDNVRRGGGVVEGHRASRDRNGDSCDAAGRRNTDARIVDGDHGTQNGKDASGIGLAAMRLQAARLALTQLLIEKSQTLRQI